MKQYYIIILTDTQIAALRNNTPEAFEAVISSILDQGDSIDKADEDYKLNLPTE